MTSDQKIYTDRCGRRWVRDANGTHGWWGGLDDVGYGFAPWSCEDADGRLTAEDGERSLNGRSVFYRFSSASKVERKVEVEVNVYEAAARIVRATIARELTKDEAERLRGLTDAGMFRAAWRP